MLFNNKSKTSAIFSANVTGAAHLNINSVNANDYVYNILGKKRADYRIGLNQRIEIADYGKGFPTRYTRLLLS